MDANRSALIVALLCAAWGAGCEGLPELRPSSKWAMDDPDYAGKYGTPYPSNDARKTQRMAKQMVDARHVAGDGGLYAKGAYSTDPDAGLAEIGLFEYPSAWSEVHAGLSILAGENDIIGFPGIDLGLRVQSPSRLAPFAGFGVYADLSQAIFDSDADDCGCEYDSHYRESFAAVYPELGVHYWLDGTHRMTLSAGYYFNSNGRNSDFWMFGLSFAGINRGDDIDEAHDIQWEHEGPVNVAPDPVSDVPPPAPPASE